MNKKHQYGPVSTADSVTEERPWMPFLRQLFVCTGPLTIYFSVGLFIGAPTIFIQQLRTEANSTDAVSVATASWLSSLFGYVSLPWIFVLTAFSHIFGRKKTFLLVSFNTILSFICFYLSETTTHLLYYTAIQGMSQAASFTISILVLSEYTSPAYRGLFLTMKSASIFWGIWFSNAIGTFFHWRNIALFGLVCSSYSLTAFFWVESPFWLASKGRIEECVKAHRWLKGTGAKAEKELLKLTTEIPVSKIGSIKQITKKQCYMPILISCLMIMQFYASGKLVCTVYSIEILKKMTTTENTAYVAMLILDGFTVFSMYMGCMMSNFCRRRVQLFTTSTIGIFFIFVLSLYLYLIKLNVMVENNVATIVILVIFSITMSSGPGIMASSIFAEVIPFKYKNISTIIISVWFQALASSLLKIFPYIYFTFGLHGTFLLYGIAMLIVTVILFRLIPETKGKTLQEIQELLNY